MSRTSLVRARPTDDIFFDRKEGGRGAKRHFFTLAFASLTQPAARAVLTPRTQPSRSIADERQCHYPQRPPPRAGPVLRLPHASELAGSPGLRASVAAAPWRRCLYAAGCSAGKLNSNREVAGLVV